MGYSISQIYLHFESFGVHVFMSPYVYIVLINIS